MLINLFYDYFFLFFYFLDESYNMFFNIFLHLFLLEDYDAFRINLCFDFFVLLISYIFLLFYHLKNFVLTLEIYIKLMQCFELMVFVLAKDCTVRTDHLWISHTYYLERLFVSLTNLLMNFIFVCILQIMDFIFLLGIYWFLLCKQNVSIFLSLETRQFFECKIGAIYLFWFLRTPCGLQKNPLLELGVEEKFMVETISDRIVAELTMNDIEVFSLNLLEAFGADIVWAIRHFEGTFLGIKTA